MLDIHTHILPGIDDGSRSSTESLEMLLELGKQGVALVAATPHFYAWNDEPESFLARRRDAASCLVESIKEACDENSELCGQIPDIVLGAEVAFFHAMSQVEIIKEMCIGGTNRLLVEMPFEKWTHLMIDELIEFKHKWGVTSVIAHIDRYFKYFEPSMLNKLVDAGIEIQVNAEAFLRLGTRRRVFSMLSEKKVHYLGSDCHNMEGRAPNIDAAIAEIEKKLGKNALTDIRDNYQTLLKNANLIFSGRHPED